MFEYCIMLFTGLYGYLFAKYRKSRSRLKDCQQRLICKDLEIEAIREVSDLRASCLHETLVELSIR